MIIIIVGLEFIRVELTDPVTRNYIFSLNQRKVNEKSLLGSALAEERSCKFKTFNRATYN